VSTFKVPNECRITEGPVATTDAAGNNGQFIVTSPEGQMFRVEAHENQDREGIKAVCVPTLRKLTADEVDFIHNKFWADSHDVWMSVQSTSVTLWKKK
jgi:hypothetical protein